MRREEALRLLTYWPAYAAFQEEDRRAVEAGEFADFTVLFADILKLRDSLVMKMRIVYAIIDVRSFCSLESSLLNNYLDSIFKVLDDAAAATDQATERFGANSATR